MIFQPSGCRHHREHPKRAKTTTTFKAVNNRDKNLTRAKVERRRAQLEESVARYLDQLDTADRHEPTEALAAKTERLKEKLAKLKEEMAKLATIEAQMLASPDQQVSLTDPDSRSMATSGCGSGVVGYNVQVTVDTEHHLIVAHEVTNSGSDRAQLANMAKQAKAVSRHRELQRQLHPRRGYADAKRRTPVLHRPPLLAPRHPSRHVIQEQP